MKRLLNLSLYLLFALALILPIKAMAAESKLSDFEAGTLGGWNAGTLTTGLNSLYALRLQHSANDSIGTKKIINAPILKGYTNLEMDVDIHGAMLLDNDAAAVVFDQGGWKMASLKKYVTNGQNGWQHVIIPLADFPSLNTANGIASITIRFWNYQPGTYDIDSIKLTSTVAPPPVTLNAPTNLAGSATSTSQVKLTWLGNGSSYNIYRNDTKITSTNNLNYLDSGLSVNTSYKYYIKTTDGTKESGASNIVDVRTLNTSTPPPPSTIDTIADFEGNRDGFDRGTLVSGYNSTNSLRLQNSVNADASTQKIFNSAVLKGYASIEFDINLNGSNILGGDAGAVIFDQAGWHLVSIKSKIGNGFNGWQHVKINLSEFPGLDTNSGIASMTFRFWNYSSGAYDIDNIKLTSDSTTPPPPIQVTAPTNLTANYLSNNVMLGWNGSGPSYIVYRNGNEIARTNSVNYSDNNVVKGQTYSYLIKATNGSAISAASNTISLAIPIETVPTINWTAKSIDSQVMSKYWAVSDDNQIASLVRANKALGAKQIAVSINFDNYALLKKWADIIHAEGLNVWFRGHWNAWDTWEKQEIQNGITSTVYLSQTKQFILSHPELFRAGDAFTMCVESENAAWWTGIDRGAFTGWESWRDFTRKQVTESNDAFNKIGLGGKIYTNWINMNGWVTWNVLDQYTVDTVGQLTIDHIIDWTDDTNTYTNALFKGNGNGFYGYDDYYNKWHVPMMAGEWGYSTYNQSIDPNHQKELANAVFSEFSKRNYIIGMNYWIDVGHASRLFDTSNLLDYTRRPVSDVIYQYYKA